jgi:hypothetical protein
MSLCGVVPQDLPQCDFQVQIQTKLHGILLVDGTFASLLRRGKFTAARGNIMAMRKREKVMHRREKDTAAAWGKSRGGRRCTDVGLGLIRRGVAVHVLVTRRGEKSGTRKVTLVLVKG